MTDEPVEPTDDPSPATGRDDAREKARELKISVTGVESAQKAAREFQTKLASTVLRDMKDAHGIDQHLRKMVASLGVGEALAAQAKAHLDADRKARASQFKAIFEADRAARAKQVEQMRNLFDAERVAMKAQAAALRGEWLDEVRVKAAALTVGLQFHAAETLAKQMESVFPKVDRERLAEAFRRSHEEFERSLPPNWEGMEFEEVTTLIGHVEETGFALAWVPRAEIVKQLAAVDSSEVAAILLAHDDEILDDVLTVLADVERPTSRHPRQALEEAVQVYRDGRTLAAQSTASSALTAVLHSLFAGMKTSKIKKRVPDWRDTLMTRARTATVLTACGVALEESRPWDPIEKEPALFNRHASAHKINEVQWNRRNALAAIMVAAALLREREFWNSHRELPLQTVGRETAGAR